MLSKTRFIHGCQCELRLWNDCFRPELAVDLDSVRQAKLDPGNEVGQLARQRYPGGVLVLADHRHPGEALAETAEALRDEGAPGIFEAAFFHGEVLVRTDVLGREADGTWNLLEVKCAGRCHGEHETDLALQAWVLKGAGIPIAKAGVLTLNTEYAFDGNALDLEKLFRFHDCTEKVAAQADEIGAAVRAQLEMLCRNAPPLVDPGPHCFVPQPCPYHGECTRNLVPPLHPVTELPRIRAALVRELAAAGIHRILDLPGDLPLTPVQERVRHCVVSRKAWVSEHLGAALQAFKAPVHYLDFETYSPPIPKYEGMHPFQRVPFQWSCHVESAEGGLYHSEFLPEDGGDPREAFALSLLAALGTTGAICVYSGFEESVVRELADHLPHLAEPLHALTGRMVDLLQIIRDHYYHPDFNGSFSIKRVLPVMVPGMGYGVLAIRQGEGASLAFLELLETVDAHMRARLIRDLLDYCSMDTLAMVKLRHALGAVAR